MTAEKRLDGTWYIDLDMDNCGRENEWFLRETDTSIEAVFPGLIQDNFPEYHCGVAWYWNRFTLDGIPEDTDAFLNVGATEYIAEFWVNGIYIGKRVGRYLYFDIPCRDALKEGENLLAIRIAFPGKDEIDGLTCKDTVVMFEEYSVNSVGGIFSPVSLSFRPKLRTHKIEVRPVLKTGEVDTDIYLHNGHEVTEEIMLCTEIISGSGENVWNSSQKLSLQSGQTLLNCRFAVKDPLPWSTDYPNLYTMVISIVQNEKIVHQSVTSIGFREFYVKDGWFFLNGKRIFFKSVYNRESFHPRGGMLTDAILYKELNQIKSMNFDSIRFHNYEPAPQILDMCDKMGLLVIQSHGASWGLKEGGRNLEEAFHYHLTETIHHDYNHPSVVAWELQNEAHHKFESDIARDSLPLVREIDKTRVVFFTSGRWDNEMSVGSISNPYSDKWDCVWGAEDPDAPPADHRITTCFSDKVLGEWTWKEDDLCCWEQGLGDVHIYPRIPLTFRGKYTLRNHAEGMKPAFLSESGSAAMGEMYEMLRKMEELGFTPNSERTRNCVICADYFTGIWNEYGLGDVYPYENDLLLAGDKLNAETRTTLLDCMRSNPQFAGFCFSCLSGPFSGFGLLDWFGERKSYIPEAVTECLAKVHWCLFVEPGHVYRMTPFTVEAVLASEDVLKPGEYPVSARIHSMQTGCVWEYHTALKIEDPGDGYMPLSFPVFKEEIALDVPRGDYVLSVVLEKGAHATGGRKTIHISERVISENKRAAVIGLDEKTLSWLTETRVVIDNNAGTVLVGDMPEDDDEWSRLYARAEKGDTVVFLKPEAFLNTAENPYDYHPVYTPEHLPFEKKGKLHYTDSWAWRIHTVLKKHRYSEGLPIGLLSDSYFDQSEPIFIYDDIQTPDEVVSVSLAAPYSPKDSYEFRTRFAGVSLGVYHYGKGNIVLNTYRILDELGSNPAAEKLLLNMIS